MADDQAMLKLLAAVDVAGAKAVIVGDHHQLDAVEAGGGLEALINRHGHAVHVLVENIRQRDPAERAALEHLRNGKVTDAVDCHVYVAADDLNHAVEDLCAEWSADRRNDGSWTTMSRRWTEFADDRTWRRRSHPRCALRAWSLSGSPFRR